MTENVRSWAGDPDLLGDSRGPYGEGVNHQRKGDEAMVFELQRTASSGLPARSAR